jgi:hypothetical protein
MKMQDLISEISKFDSEREIISSEIPTQAIISLDYKVEEESDDEEFEDDHHLIEMSYFDFGNDDRLK